MNKITLFNAINALAKELGLFHWMEIQDEWNAPMAMNQLAGVAWVKEHVSENSEIVKQQLKNLWETGSLGLI